jgi:tetratricopeptide (TPR) repeat protein
VYRSLGRLDDAAADYRRLIELKPQNPDAYVGLALVYDKQGRVRDAEACYEQLVAADPNSAVPFIRRAVFLRDHGQWEPALADCDRAARKDPSSFLPALVRASITAARGDHRAAVAAAEQVLEQAPKYDGHVLYTAACVWSLAAQAAAAGPAADQELAGRYADRAAALLTQTLDKGFHDLLYPEHNRMTEDPALAAVRERPQVRDLLAHRPS